MARAPAAGADLAVWGWAMRPRGHNLRRRTGANGARECPA